MASFYLTIDDGPTTDTINKLNFFNNNQIKAVWFCLGKNLEQHSDIAIRLIRHGHIIGNHSYSHPFFSQITYDECRNEIVQTERIINDLYEKSGVSRTTKIFRFPYGDQGYFENDTPLNNQKKLLHKEKLQKLLKKLNFQSSSFLSVQYKNTFRNQYQNTDWLWSYDIQEWAINHSNKNYKLTYAGIKDNLNNYLKNFDRKKDQLILLHDHEKNARYFSLLMNIFSENKIIFELPRFI